MNEFQFIQEYLAPLSKDNLSNDGALIDIPAGKQLVVTTDTLIAGRHFLGIEPPNLLAQKALRVNLSDLAAMGAKPLCYNLALSFDKPPTREWAQAFSQGLKEDQDRFSLYLLGGDTTSGTQYLTITVSMFGLVDRGKALVRCGAQTGDVLYHSGELGLGPQGLKDLQNNQQTIAAQHYQKPQPRIELGLNLIGLTSSCLDISDGLAQDAAHIARQSNKQLVIETENINGNWQETGDDYELLFTVPPAKESQLKRLQDKHSLTKIGYVQEMQPNQLPVVFLKNNQPVPLPTGFTHF